MTEQNIEGAMSIDMEPVEPVVEDFIAILRDDDKPERIIVFPRALRTFKLSPLDAAILWFVTEHTSKHGFFFLTNAIMAAHFNVTGQTVRNSLKKLSCSDPYPLVRQVHRSKEQKSEYVEKVLVIRSKNQRKGLLKAAAYAVTPQWVTYINLWLGKNKKTGSVMAQESI